MLVVAEHVDVGIVDAVDVVADQPRQRSDLHASDASLGWQRVERVVVAVRVVVEGNIVVVDKAADTVGAVVDVDVGGIAGGAAVVVDTIVEEDKVGVVADIGDAVVDTVFAGTACAVKKFVVVGVVGVVGVVVGVAVSGAVVERLLVVKEGASMKAGVQIAGELVQTCVIYLDAVVAVAGVAPTQNRHTRQEMLQKQLARLESQRRQMHYKPG